MKKTVHFVAFVATLIIATINYSCKSDRYDVLVPNEVKGDLVVGNSYKSNRELVVIDFKDSISGSSIKIETSLEDSVLKSKISYRPAMNWVEVNNFEIDLKDGRYREKMASLVKKKAENITSRFDAAALANISDILESIPETLFKRIGRANFYKESSHAMFYQLAVINTSRRALISTSKNCDCGINVSYLKDKTPFACLEDKLVSADEAIKLVTKMSNGPALYGKTFKPMKSMEYLEKNVGKPVTASKLRQIIYAEIDDYWSKEFSETQRLAILAKTKKTTNKLPDMRISSDDPPEVPPPLDGTCTPDPPESPYVQSAMSALGFCAIIGVTLGTECGCCGNYPGRCLCCDPVCLLHDIACATCSHWYCGWACVPNGC